jgi:hypothetical protein
MLVIPSSPVLVVMLTNPSSRTLAFLEHPVYRANGMGMNLPGNQGYQTPRRIKPEIPAKFFIVPFQPCVILKVARNRTCGKPGFCGRFSV